MKNILFIVGLLIGMFLFVPEEGVNNDNLLMASKQEPVMKENGCPPSPGDSKQRSKRQQLPYSSPEHPNVQLYIQPAYTARCRKNITFYPHKG